MLFSLYQDSTKPWGNHFSDEYTQRHFKIAIPNIFKILQIINQDVIFNAHEIKDSGDTNYPYQINISKYIPPSKILAVRVWGTKTSQSASSTDYVIKGNMLKIKQRVRQIEYQFSSEGWGLGEVVDMYSDPYMRLPNSEAK